MTRLTQPIIRDGFKEAIEMATWRVENLLSKSAFASAMGVTYKTILHIESGLRRPQKCTYEKFCVLRDRYTLRKKVDKQLTPRERVHLEIWGELPKAGVRAGLPSAMAGKKNPNAVKAMREGLIRKGRIHAASKSALASKI